MLTHTFAPLRSLMSLSLMLGLGVLIPSQAFAYLDPGTGSVILQVFLAGILGAVFTLKTYWRSVKAYFAKFCSKSKKDT